MRAVLDRPVAQRVMEFRYRFGQAVVFGLPVVALQVWGRSLGGAEAERWVAVLQALLAGWVVYLAATGMVFEGVLALGQGRVTADLIVGAAALGLYAWSATALITVPISGALWHHHTMFHVCVVLIAVWCGARWMWLRRASAKR